MVCPVGLITQGRGKVDFTPANCDLCFDATDVDIAADSITFNEIHGFISGDQVTPAVADTDPGTLPAELPAGTPVYVIVTGERTIQLAASYDNAVAATPTPITLTDAGTGRENRITISEKFSARARSINLQPNVTQTDATSWGEDPRYVGGDRINGTGSITFQLASDSRQNRLGREQKGSLGDALLEIYLDAETAVANQRIITFNAFLQPPQFTLQASATDNPPIEATVNLQITNYRTSVPLFG